MLFAIGTGLNVTASLHQANMQKKADKRQIAQLTEQARLIEAQGEFEALETGKQFEKLLGEQKFNIATSGAEQEGSVINILDKTLQDKTLNMKMIRDNAKQQADYLNNQAFLLRKQRKKRTRNALMSSALNTVSSGINFGMQSGMQNNS
jgi:hypothetical protein